MIYTLETFLSTFKSWPAGFWTRFWFTNQPFKKINVHGYEFWVRGNNLLAKLADVLIENKISKCHFLKIDCEGAEYEILLNTPIAILKKIDQIALEYHSPKLCGLNDYYALDKLQAHLRTASYQITVVKEDYRGGYVYALRK